MKVRTEWAYNLERTIFSIIKARAENSLKNKYPKIRFTNEEEADGNAIFPTVLIQSVQPLEKVADLEKINIDTVLYTTQVTITTNKSRNEALNIAYEIADKFKQMAFTLNPMPFVRKENKVYTATFRASRTFDWNDII